MSSEPILLPKEKRLQFGLYPQSGLLTKMIFAPNSAMQSDRSLLTGPFPPEMQYYSKSAALEKIYREGTKQRSCAKECQLDLIFSRNFAPSLLRGEIFTSEVSL
jgi:hypothetical protein